MRCFNRHLARIGACIFGLSLAGCEADTSLVKTEPPVVTVSQPIEKDITDYDQYTGRLEPAESVEVRARVRGELTGIHFTDGAIVKAGALLYEIDPRPYKAALDAAKARKANAEAGLGLAKAEYERTYKLYQQNAASAKDVEVWVAKKGVAIADLSLADADIDRAKLDLEFCTIKAPITGKIGRSLLTKGNQINSSGGETLLTTIVSVDPIYVYFDVDERSLQLFRERRKKELGTSEASNESTIPVFMGLIADGDRFPRKGVIDFADNKINPATGTIRVRGVFANKDGQLTPGQFARVRLPVGKQYKGLLVTDQAVGIDQGQKYLLVVGSDNKVEYRPVTPGGLEDGLRVFKPGAGIAAGDWIIVNGVQRVRPGITANPERVAMPVLNHRATENTEKRKKNAATQ
jgi:multidrug efflux system membrane fusion protein